MKFEKRLVILSGENNAKGTVMLERNAYGTFATVNVYNIPDLLAGEYALGIKNSEEVFTRKVGSMGRIMSRFKINDMNLSSLHCIVYATATEKPLLYGHTPDIASLWAGNMMDGIRSRKVEFPQTVDKTEIDKALPRYSDRPQEIEDYFLDILPAGAAYSDNAVAQVNYYPSDMSIEVSYSKREQSGYVPQENPVDKHVRESVERESPAREESEKIMPWQYAKMYLSRFSDNPANGVLKNIGPSEKAEQNASDTPEIANGNNAENAQVMSVSEKSDKEAQTENAAQAEENVKHEAAATVSTAVIPPVSGFTPENALKDKKTEAVFYEQIRNQLDELFGSNPRFEILEKAMPDTKWIKVDYDGSGKYYVVGLIGAKPDYICYGVPASFTPTPPSELDGYCQWLPLDGKAPEGDGFWIMYQDAVSGESVKK